MYSYSSACGVMNVRGRSIPRHCFPREKMFWQPSAPVAGPKKSPLCAQMSKGMDTWVRKTRSGAGSIHRPLFWRAMARPLKLANVASDDLWSLGGEEGRKRRCDPLVAAGHAGFAGEDPWSRTRESKTATGARLRTFWQTYQFLSLRGLG